MIRKRVKLYIDIYVRVPLGGHNLGASYARKLKFGILLTQTYVINFVLEQPLGHALG